MRLDEFLCELVFEFRDGAVISTSGPTFLSVGFSSSEKSWEHLNATRIGTRDRLRHIDANELTVMSPAGNSLTFQQASSY